MTAKLSFFQKYMYSSMILNGIWKSIDIYDADVIRYVNNQNIKTKKILQTYIKKFFSEQP